MNARVLSLLLATFAGVSVAQAIDLREATFTQVVNSVTVTNPQGGDTRAAQVSTQFTTPDIIRTGVDSRAELTAADQTVTRVGANTIFSFKPEGRGINLQKGSVLFNSPTGRGGGTIQTAAATASVLGTTIIVTTTSNGGFKLLVLEGKAKATLANGRDFVLKAGQMAFIAPGQTQSPAIFEFRLGKQNDGSGLLKGFSKPLPAQDKVQQAVMVQDVKIANGEKADTGLMIGQVVGNQIQIIDPSLIQAAMQTRINDDNYDELIKKLQQEVTVTQTVSTTMVDDGNVLLFPSAEALVRGLKAIDARVGNLNNPPDTTHVFAAYDLDITTTSLDLSPYSGKSKTFAFYAKNYLFLPVNLGIAGYGGELIFHADVYLNIPTSMTLSYSGTSLGVEANNTGGLSLTTVNFSNYGGDLRVTNRAGNLSVGNGSFLAADEISFESGNDLTLNSPSLTANSLYLSASNDISLNSVSFTSGGGPIDVYAGGTMSASGGVYSASNIDLYAANSMNINSGASFDSSSDIDMTAASGLLNLYGATLTASNYIRGDGGDISITNSMLKADGNIVFGSSSPTLLTLSTSTLIGNIVDLYAQTIVSTSSSIIAQDNMTLSSSGTIDISGGTFTTNTNSINITGSNVTTTYGSYYANKDLYISAVVGTVSLDNGSFTAKNTLNVTAKNINITTSTFSSGSPGTGTATFTAGNGTSDALSMSNVNFNTTSYFGSISMQAYTINLSDVTFATGQNVHFVSGNGGINFGSSVPGTLNFVSNVRVGSNAITDASSYSAYGTNLTHN